jgi:hypothetical protein
VNKGLDHLRRRQPFGGEMGAQGLEGLTELNPSQHDITDPKIVSFDGRRLQLCPPGRHHFLQKSTQFTGADLVDMGIECAPHAGFPHTAEMAGDVLDRLITVGHGGEKAADLIGHADQFLSGHAIFSSGLALVIRWSWV